MPKKYIILGVCVLYGILPAYLWPQDEETIISYPSGIYSIWPVDQPLNSDILDNPAITGIFLTGGGKWSVVEPEQDVYDFSLYDHRIAEAASAGKGIILAIPHNANAVPDWLRRQARQFMTLMDGCSETTFPVFWDEIYRQQRLELIHEFGRRYGKNRTVVAVSASFAGTKTGDWNLNFSKGECGGERYDNGQNWFDAGYSTTLMLEIGREVVLNTARSFPDHALKISLGVSPVDDTTNVTKYTLADSIAAFGRKNFPLRFFVQMSNLNLKSPRADDQDVVNATPSSRRYLQKILANASPYMGWQLLDSATRTGERCRLGAGVSPCPPTRELMAAVLDIALSYQPHFIEVWCSDGVNSELISLFKEKSPTLQTGLKTPSPLNFILHQNYPNPFNPQTTIRFEVREKVSVVLEIFNHLGERVLVLLRGIYDPGRYTIRWYGRDKFGRELPSGLYFAHLRTPSGTWSRKMLLLR